MMHSHSPASLLRVTTTGGHMSATFPPATRLTEDNVETVAREFAALIAGREQPRVLLDLGTIDYLTSVALSKFLALNKQVRAAGGQLTLVNLQPQIRQVFTV